MTICVAVAVNDGVVFAADSASTLSMTRPDGTSIVSNVYKNGLKVFNLYKGKPLVAMTCGLGNFGTESISSLAKEFRYRLMHGDADQGINEKNFTVEEVVSRAKSFLYDEKFKALDRQPTSQFEFWIAGYPSEMSGKFELWKIVFTGGNCQDPVKLGDPGETGIHWGGAISPISRLILGFDPSSLWGAVTKAMESMSGTDEKTKAEIVNHIITTIRNHSVVQLSDPSMPIQDAIDLASYLADTAKRFYRFLPGSDIVGGDTDIAVITRYEGFKWVERKHYYPAELNRLETDHV